METPFPPFDADGDDPENGSADETATRLRDIPLRTIFPNLLTLLAICSGLTSIRFAIEGRIELAVAAIIFAGFLDGIDGRVARFLKSTTRFGAQMDSLADFVNFGVAPAMLIYFSLSNVANSIGWIAALIYVICACLRLARFNVMLDNPDLPQWRNNFFIGVPAPAGAIVVLLPVYAMLLGVEPGISLGWAATALSMLVGMLMVSNIPTFSGKNFSQKIRRDLVAPILIVTVFSAAVFLTYPWTSLCIVALLYVISVPFSHLSWQRFKNAGEEAQESQDT